VAVDLDLDKNRFVGTVPSFFGLLPSIQYISLDNNKLHGPIPSSLGLLTQLRVLLLQKNSLTGHINSFLWQPENMTYLFNVDLSSNRLTGRMRNNVFRLPALQILSLSVNCLRGPLPAAVCDSQGAVVLSMDGLSSAEQCGNKVRAPFITTLLYEDFSGSIPKCLWLLPNITTIHLSGNGLKGKIGHIPPYSRLRNVSLTHNKLSGTIPKSFQEWPFHFLDLSNNKFSGQLSQHISSIYTTSTHCSGNSCPSNFTSRLDLSINRLSGAIPPPLSGARRINILSGNLFGCGGEAPGKDPESDFFLCGSSLLDNALLALVVVLSVVAGLVAAVGVVVFSTQRGMRVASWPAVVWASSVLAKCRVYWNVCDALTPGSLPSLRSFDTLLYQICLGISGLALIGIGLLIPVYALKIADIGESVGRFATHMHMYRWILSLAYVTGNVPGALVLCAWALIMFVATYVLRMDVKGSAPGEGVGRASERVSEWSQDGSSVADSALGIGGPASGGADGMGEFRSSVVSVAATVGDRVQEVSPVDALLQKASGAGRVLLNLGAVLTVNIAYIYSTMRNLSRRQTVAIQFALAAFMLFWNFLVVPSRLLTHAEDPVERVWTKVLLLVLNSIALPCLATALQSPSCFRVGDASCILLGILCLIAIM
jgi:hypothetical protein